MNVYITYMITQFLVKTSYLHSCLCFVFDTILCFFVVFLSTMTFTSQTKVIDILYTIAVDSTAVLLSVMMM